MQQLLSQYVDLSTEYQVGIHHRICEFRHWKVIERVGHPPLESHDQHSAVPSRWDRNGAGPNPADPGIPAGLKFSQGLVVIDMLGIAGQFKNKFSISVRQEAIHVVNGIDAFIIDEVLDELIDGESGGMNLHYHIALSKVASQWIGEIIEHFFLFLQSEYFSKRICIHSWNAEAI